MTSAETVLLSSANLDAVRSTLIESSPAERAKLRVVVALSQQAVASLAVEIGLGLQACAEALAGFFQNHLGADAVIDVAFARHLVHAEAGAEFVRRYRAREGLVVASACPGWVTYAEKTQGEAVLGRISEVRSPQAVVGGLAGMVLGEEGRRTWVLCVMPCHDKKIEAARFEEAGEREVGAVLTAGEVLDLAREMDVDLKEVQRGALDDRFSVGRGFGTRTGSGSGGYAEYVLRVAAKEILGVEMEEVAMEKVSRSGDVRSITVKSEDGKRQLRFGTAYGFRSLQSVLRKVRQGKCEYDYIELMACPGGCNNGGGQVPEESGDKKAMAAQLEEVEKVYMETENEATPMTVPGVVEVLKELRSSGNIEKALQTKYKRREQNVVQALNNW